MKVSQAQEVYSIQYSKNYNLLLKKYQNLLSPDLDMEYMNKLYDALLFDDEFAKKALSLRKQQIHKLLFILLGFLSIYEVKINLSHFNYVFNKFSNSFKFV